MRHKVGAQKVSQITITV